MKLVNPHMRDNIYNIIKTNWRNNYELYNLSQKDHPREFKCWSQVLDRSLSESHENGFENSLYYNLGGTVFIEAFVDNLFENIMNDNMLSWKFESGNPKFILARSYKFSFTRLFGGPNPNSRHPTIDNRVTNKTIDKFDYPLAMIHRYHSITPEEFDRFMVHVEKAIRLNAMSRDEREEWILQALGLIGEFKDQICNIGNYDEYQHDYIADRKFHFDGDNWDDNNEASTNADRKRESLKQGALEKWL